MKSIRVIPCLDVDRGRVVKGVNFVGLRDAGDPVELPPLRQETDEIVFLDIPASSDNEKRRDHLKSRRRGHIPFTIGGGIRSTDDSTSSSRWDGFG